MNENDHIDRQKALQWLEGDERMFVKMKSMFLKNIPSQVGLLKEFLDAGDNTATERAAHTIMGSSAMLGACGMSDEAREIERSAIVGDIDSARHRFIRFVEEYEKVMAELVAEVENL